MCVSDGQYTESQTQPSPTKSDGLLIIPANKMTITHKLAGITRSFMNKICKLCGENKSIDEFGTSYKKYKRSYCKECAKPINRLKTKTYYSNPDNLEKINKRRRELYKLRKIEAGKNYTPRGTKKEKDYDYVTTKIRFEVFKRDKFICQYCGKRPPEIILQVDHLIPKSKGGSNKKENLITACRECNHGKNDRYIFEF